MAIFNVARPLLPNPLIATFAMILLLYVDIFFNFSRERVMLYRGRSLYSCITGVSFKYFQFKTPLDGFHLPKEVSGEGDLFFREFHAKLPWKNPSCGAETPELPRFGGFLPAPNSLVA
jgi:hypothetical protein